MFYFSTAFFMVHDDNRFKIANRSAGKKNTTNTQKAKQKLYKLFAFLGLWAVFIIKLL